MEYNKLLNIIKTGVGITHPATFHADDVLATCLLRLINPKFRVKRSNVIPSSFNGLIYDIGLKEYDHHQANAEIRKNGIKYASFGLLWRDLSPYFMDKEHAELFDKVFVSEIDRCDNGPDTNLLSSSIAMFNPTWNSEESSDLAFEKAVSVFTPVLESLIYHFRKSTFIPRFCVDVDEALIRAFNITYCDITGKRIDIPNFADIRDVWEKYGSTLIPNESPELFEKNFLLQVKRTYGKFKTSPFVLAITCLRRKDRVNFLVEVMKKRIQNINSLEPARKLCETTYQKSKRKDLIIFEQYVPTDSLNERHRSVRAVIFPSNRGGYTLLCATMNIEEKLEEGLNPEKTYPRMEIAEELRGQSENYLRGQYDGLFFVHPAGFMASCDTLESAISLYQHM